MTETVSLDRSEGYTSPFHTVDHIAVAVRHLDDGLQQFVQLLGTESTNRQRVGEQHVDVAFLHCTNTALELIAPADVDEESATTQSTPIDAFLASRGEGLHHVAFLVPDVTEALAWCVDHGYRCIDVAPRIGAEGREVAFLHPKQFAGVLIELCGPVPVAQP